MPEGCIGKAHLGPVLTLRDERPLWVPNSLAAQAVEQHDRPLHYGLGAVAHLPPRCREDAAQRSEILRSPPPAEHP